MSDVTTTTTERDATRPTAHPAAPRAGAAWKVIGAVLALAALAWGTFEVIGLLAHEEHTETTTVDATGLAVVDIDNSAGSIIVVGRASADEVKVTADISEGLRPTGNRLERVGDRLELEGSCPNFGSDWCDVRYTVEMPAGLALVANGDDGRVEVTGIDARVEVDNDNGPIELDDLGGVVVADNDNGGIVAERMRAGDVRAATDNGRVTIQFVEAPTAVDARSDNGSVEVVVPATGDAYNVDVTTDNGSEDARTLTHDPDSSRTMVVHSDNGDATARVAR